MTTTPAKSAPDKAASSSALPLLLMGYAALVILGAGLLLAPFSMRPGNSLSLQRAVFTSCNAVSLTGFPSTAMRPEDLATPGRWIVLALTFASIVLTLTTAGCAIARWGRSTLSLGEIFVGSTLCTLLAALLGSAGLVGDRVDFFAGTLNALAAFGNSALHMGSVPGAADWRTYAVVLPLAVIGSMGTVALVDLYHGRISDVTKRTASLLAGAYLACFAILSLVHLLSDGQTSVAANSSILSISTRTLGLPIVEVRELPRVVQWTLMPLMMAGGVSGGTAGGLKITTLFVLFLAIRAALRGQPIGRLAGVAGLWVCAYLLMFVVTTLMLLGTEPEITTDQAPFMAISALSCVGLTRDPISITGNGLYVLSLAMLFGRVVPLIFLWWSTDSSDEFPVG